MKDNNKDIGLLGFFLCLRAVLAFIPAAEEYSSVILNVFTLGVVYFLLFSYIGGSFIFKIIVQYLPLYIVIFFNFIYGYKSFSLFEFLYGIMQWFMWPIAIMYIVNTKRRKTAVWLFYTALICIIITATTTYFGNLANPGASRGFAAVWSDETETAHLYRRLNIGGFEFIYLLVLLLTTWIYIIRVTKEYIVRFIIIITIVVSLFSIFESQYTTAVIVSLLCFFLLLLPSFFSTKRLLLMMSLGIIAVVIATSLMSSLFEYFANNIESNEMAERLTGVSDVLAGRDVEGDAEARQFLFSKSWEAFIKNPVTGTRGVGGHSYILDTLGHFGVLGIILLAIVFRRLYVLCVKQHRNSMLYGYVLFAYFCQIFLALVNTQIFFQFFIIMVPLIGFVFNPNKNRGKIAKGINKKIAFLQIAKTS